MIKAIQKDKDIVVDILCRSFDANISVNYVVKQDRKRKQRLRNLMDYSFEMCFLFGEVYLSEDKKGCALLLFPDKKKASLKSMMLDAKLVFNCIGLFRLRKIMKRDAEIESSYPKEPILYLWFIGVIPEEQHKGIGSYLLNSIIQESENLRRPIYLETSKKENLRFYNAFGFITYDELNFGHPLFLVKREHLTQTHLTL